jgi:hypothetical protein
MPALVLRLIVALGAVLTGTMAAEAEWFVSRISGVALARVPGSAAFIVLARGSTVSDSAAVETGRTGRLKMTRGASAIVRVAQNGRFRGLDDGLSARGRNRSGGLGVGLGSGTLNVGLGGGHGVLK